MIEVYGFYGQKALFENRRLLEAARDGVCQNCGVDDETVVAAHGNEDEMGKGKALKAHDIYHAHLCGKCHDYVDSRAPCDPNGVFGNCIEDRRECFRRAMLRTWLWLVLKGRLRVT